MASTIFFQNLASFLEGADLTINLKSKDGIITMSLLPRPLTGGKNSAKDTPLSPILLTGTALEIDEGFMDAIQKPLSDVGGLVVHLEEFKKSLQDKKEKKEEEIKSDSKPKSSSSTPKKKNKGQPAKGTKADESKRGPVKASKDVRVGGSKKAKEVLADSEVVKESTPIPTVKQTEIFGSLEGAAESI